MTTTTVEVDYRKLKDATLFKSLPDEALAELASHCRYLELHAGEFLFYQDDPGDALYILQDGQIHIVRTYSNGEEVVLATEVPYYAIGELSMLANTPRTGGVLAVSDCTLIALSRDAFMDICGRIPGVMVRVQTHLAQRLYRMNLLVRENAISNVTARVANAVLLMSGGKTGALPQVVSLHRLARAVAIDANTVEKIFKEWAQQGLASYDGRRLTIYNVSAIEKMV